MATTLTPQTTTTATTAVTNPYKGYNDPLAQEIYKKYNPWITQKGAGKGGISPWDRMMQLGEFYGRPGSGVSYHAPYDPSQWGTSRFGPTVDKMKAEYLARGGLGTTEQFYAQQAAARKAKEAGAGSQHTLSPSILNKMWR